MKLTDKTITSKYQPKQTNVAWMDVSGDKPVLKYYTDGKWTAVSGSGLPEPTADDEGKVMQVKKRQTGTSMQETVVIPEQTVVISETPLPSEEPYEQANESDVSESGRLPAKPVIDRPMLQDVNSELFVEGAQIKVTVNGQEYTSTIVLYGDSLLVAELISETMGIVKPPIDPLNLDSDYGFIFSYNEPGEYTVKAVTMAEQPEYSYNWELSQGLPEPTEEDEGKTMVVKKNVKKQTTHEETVVIIPEMQPEGGAGHEITDGNPEGIVYAYDNNKEVTVVINGIEYQFVVDFDGIKIFYYIVIEGEIFESIFGVDGMIEIYYYSNKNMVALMFEPEGDVSQPTISAYIKEIVTDTEYSYDWEIDTAHSLSNVVDLENMPTLRKPTEDEGNIMNDTGFVCDDFYGILDAVDDKGNPPMYFLLEGDMSHVINNCQFIAYNNSSNEMMYRDVFGGINVYAKKMTNETTGKVFYPIYEIIAQDTPGEPAL